MLENKVYILDNLVSKKYQDYIHDLFYSEIKFNLNPPDEDSSGYNTHYKDTSNKWIDLNHNIKDQIYDSSQMTSIFVLNTNILEQNLFNFYKLIPLYNIIQNYFNYTFHYHIIRCKANLKHQLNSKYKDKFNSPHVDFFNNTENLWSLIYYINDSDGDTIIYNESINPNKPINHFTIEQTIPPKKGRLLFFPCHRFHSANFPTQFSTRLVLNTVLEIFPK